MKSQYYFCLLAMLCAFLWSGCQTAPGTRASHIAPTVTRPITIEPVLSPTSPESLRLTSTPVATLSLLPTSIRLQSPNKILLLEYNPAGAEAKSDIWLLPPPYQKARPFRAHDADYTYCCPVWSPDGQRLAYVRTSVTASVSSLWVSQPDGSDAHSIGKDVWRESLPIGIQTISPVGWSADGKQILLAVGDNIYLVDAETGVRENLDYLSALVSVGVDTTLTMPHIIQVDSKSGEVLLHGLKDEQLVFLETNLEQFGQLKILTPPEDYAYIDSPDREVSLSPDGRFLLLADYERDRAQERLWRVDVENNHWDLIISRPAEFIPNSISWSPDQQWVAWWLADRDIEGNYYLYIAFLSIHSWKITREYKFSGTPLFARNAIVGWTTDSQGNSGFAVLENKPGRGLVLLKPDGGEKEDVVLVSYDQLVQQLPFKPEEAEWAWQP